MGFFKVILEELENKQLDSDPCLDTRSQVSAPEASTSKVVPGGLCTMNLRQSAVQ